MTVHDITLVVVMQVSRCACSITFFCVQGWTVIGFTIMIWPFLLAISWQTLHVLMIFKLYWCCSVNHPDCMQKMVGVPRRGGGVVVIGLNV